MTFPLLTIVALALGGDPSGVLPIDDFNDGVQNRLGGYRNTFQRSPSTASAMRVADVYRGPGGRSVRIDVRRDTAGFCGYWIHLFDFRLDTPSYLDATPYGYLSFHVKGERGGESFEIKAADRQWIAKEDSVSLGGVEQYLAGGITAEWQEVIVPLGRAAALDVRQLGGVTFDFSTGGRHTVYIDDLCLKRSPSLPSPRTNALAARAAARRDCPRALWVWTTAEIVVAAAERKRLIEFSRRENINQLWMQLPYSVEPAPVAEDESSHVVRAIKHEAELRRFLLDAHAAGIHVHALDGDPEFAQRQYHAIPLGVVDAVIAFNRRGATTERFDGIHFDNEPYLIVGWQQRGRRERILREFLELNRECQRRVDAQPGLEFGIDIPFWWQESNERTGEPNADVLFAGVRKAASYHCIDMLDNVGIMNYRDSADGADGMIVHGRDLLAYADRAGAATIYMGVETFASRDTDVWFAVGLPRDEFERALSGPGKHYAQRSRMHGLRLRTYDDGRRVHVGVEEPDDPRNGGRVLETIKEIAEIFGISAAHPADELSPIIAHAERQIAADPECDRFRRRTITDAVGDVEYAGFTLQSRMLSKVTFADDSVENLRAQIRAAEDYFSRHESFGGMAIHFYNRFREKLAD